MLAEVALALGVLDLQLGAQHGVADAPDAAAPRGRCRAASSRRCRGWPARGRGSPCATRPRRSRRTRGTRARCRRTPSSRARPAGRAGGAGSGAARRRRAPPSSQSMSARHIAVPSCQGTRRSVARSGMHHEVAVAALPRRHRRSRDRCPCRRRRRAGSCRPRRRASTTSSRKWGAVRRLPWRRPCMSASASSTVSISPVSTSERSWLRSTHRAYTSVLLAVARHEARRGCSPCPPGARAGARRRRRSRACAAARRAAGAARWSASGPPRGGG